MTVRLSRGLAILALAGAMIGTLPTDASAIGPGDLKKKAEKEAKKAAEKAAGTTATPDDSTPESATPAGSAKAPDGGKISNVSTKFDYVPGDKVLFMDDFTQDELGEFPVRWTLVQGTFEVAEMNGERWMRCTSSDSHIRPKLPAMAELPEYWTLEFDFYSEEYGGSFLTVSALNGKESQVWRAVFPQGTGLFFETGGVHSATPLEGSDGTGRHHMMLMAKGKALKVYIDRQRVASIPEISAEPGSPTQIGFRLAAATPTMITNVRFAEFSKPKPDLLATPFITHGIIFDSGSDRLKPESAPVMRQITAYMKEHPDVSIVITGHTDNVGADAANLSLSEKRAAAVAASLAADFGVDATRMITAGKGESAAMATNDSPEGRAMNRRVEFAKR